MLDQIISQLLSEKSLAITLLVGANGALCWALLKSWSWHRKDRDEDRTRWTLVVEESNNQLKTLVEAITQLRIIVSQCSGGSRSPWGR